MIIKSKTMTTKTIKNTKIYVETQNGRKPRTAMSEESTMGWESIKLISEQCALGRDQNAITNHSEHYLTKTKIAKLKLSWMLVFMCYWDDYWSLG